MYWFWTDYCESTIMSDSEIEKQSCKMELVWFVNAVYYKSDIKM